MSTHRILLTHPKRPADHYDLRIEPDPRLTPLPAMRSLPDGDEPTSDILLNATELEISSASVR